jgi:aldose 1-epimerase
VLELRSTALRLALRPDLGGSVAGLWLNDLPVLRSVAGTQLQAPRDAACFPLVPYSNRLGYRKFSWRGRDYEVRPNRDGELHAPHGVSWLQPWNVKAADSTTAELEYTHPSGPDWPFAFHVSQRFELTENTLSVTLTATNIDARSAPMGLGWHPFFPKRERSRVHLELTDRWDYGATKLPTRKVAQPGIDADVAALEFDNCFEGWSGQARIRDERLSLRLSSSLTRVVVYTPPNEPYYCIEPVSHVNNAINMADPESLGLAALSSGQSVSAWMKLEVARAA